MFSRRNISTVFTESRRWKKIQDSKHEHEKRPEDAVYQFFNLLGGKVIGEAYGQCIPFETHVDRIASDLVYERQWNYQPLALAETFPKSVFHNFAEVDWEIQPGRSPLMVSQIRKCAEVMAVTIRKFVHNMPSDVSIVVCTTLDSYGNPIPYEEDYFKCTGCKHGRAEQDSTPNVYTCTFCASQWKIADQDSHGHDDNEENNDGDNNSDGSIDATDILQAREANNDAPANNMSNRRGSDSSGAAVPNVRSSRNPYILLKTGRASNNPTPQMYRKRKLKNGMHLRCRNFPVDQLAATQLRRCYIHALTSAFPTEPSEAWDERIDTAPLVGRSIRACGMHKKGTCCHCKNGKIRDVSGPIDCMHCRGSGNIAIDKRYGVADELVLGKGPSEDYWLTDRAQSEQVAHAQHARSCGDDSRDALGYDNLPASDRLEKFRNADNTEENWRFILLQTSISNVPAGTRSVEVDQKKLRRVPNGEIVKKFRRQHRGKTVEYRMWQTMLSKNTRRTKKNRKNSETIRDRSFLRKVHTIIRRMFPYPKLLNGCYDMDIRDHEHSTLGQQRQQEYLKRREEELLVTTDLENRDMPPSPFDEATVEEVKYSSQRKDRAFIKLTGTGAHWCPQKHREKLSAMHRGTAHDYGSSEHGSCPSYFVATRVAILSMSEPSPYV